MATVIDQLVVKLGLDSTDFEAGEKRVDEGLNKTKVRAEKTGKDIEDNGKRAANFFGQIEKAAIKFFAVLTVGRGLSDFTRTIIGTGAQLDRMSNRLGTSADTLSRWVGAVRQSGGTTEGFLGTVQGLSASLTELKLTGNTGILPYLQALGVSVADADGKAKPFDQLLGEIGDKLNKLPNKSDAFNIGRNLGLDDGTINLLMKGRTEVTRLLNLQKAYSDSDAEAARKAQENWEAAQLRIERTTQLLVIKLIPAFEKLTKSATDLADISVPTLSGIYSWLEKIDGITGKWAAKIDSLIPKFKNPILQKLFGGNSGALLRANPATGIAGTAAAAGQSLRDYLPKAARNAADKARDEVLAFFGNAGAKKRLQLDKYGDTNVGNPLRLFDLQGKSSEPGTLETDAGSSRAERNNNPGNLEFAGQTGATRESGSGRFAKFSSTAEGVAALVKQLKRYGGRGLNTLDKIVNTYAPASENNTKAYIAALAKQLGVNPDQQLDLENADTLSGLVKGISRHESGSNYLSDKDVLSGLQLAGVGGGQAQGNSTTIGEIKVYTQATDANGIARDIKGAMVRQADQGMR